MLFIMDGPADQWLVDVALYTTAITAIGASFAERANACIACVTWRVRVTLSLYCDGEGEGGRGTMKLR